MLRTLVPSVALLSALLIGGSAFAQDTMSVKVSFADLNLATPAGASAFQHRIGQAVTEICGSPGAVNLVERSAVEACRNDVIAANRSAVQTALATQHGSETLAEIRRSAPAGR